MKRFLYVLVAVIMVVSSFAFTASAADSVDLSAVAPKSWVQFHSNSENGLESDKYSIGLNTDADNKSKKTMDLMVDGKKVTYSHFIQLHTCNEQMVNGKPSGNIVWDISSYNYNKFTVIAGLDAAKANEAHTNYTNVYIDDQLVYDGSKNIYTGAKAIEITVDVPAGAKTLKLESITPNKFETQNCVWAEPTLYNAKTERTLKVTKVTSKSVTFKYTGAQAGDNNWVAVYNAGAKIPDDYSLYYVYLADGDGEYTIDLDKCIRNNGSNDDYKPGTMMSNVDADQRILEEGTGKYKLVWLGGPEWYDTFVEVPLTVGNNPSTSDGALAVALVAIAAAGAVVLAKKKH